MWLSKLSLCPSWPKRRSRKLTLATSSPLTTSSSYDSQDSITITEKLQSISAKEVASEASEAICNKIIETHRQLLTLPNYEPGNKINKLLGDLVPLCTQAVDNSVAQEILDNPKVQAILPSLRDICSKSESCFEFYSAAKIIGDGKDGPEKALERAKNFRYYSNYVELAWLELCAIRAARQPSSRKIAFIGSGPLPLTSLCLLQEIKREIRPGSKPEDIRFLNGMEFLCAQAGSPEVDLREYDVVYLAALVGMSQEEKEEITLRVAETMRPGSLLVVRSAAGIRKCLYLEFDIATDRLLQKLEPCLTLHPHNEVVNSVIVARVK
ncbi:Nicotianamine synthase domain containing protein [Naviculisporaceae sp. PSN 640]